tara:strand:+ start:66 stop:542 length:477 start_codon:yes stop_codon:yes gene_type:complete
MFFLAPALPYLGAGIAGLGAAARGFGTPQGQRVLQGGINTLNRVGTKLQDFLNPVGQPIYQTFFGPGRRAQKIGAGIAVGEPFEDAIMDAGSSISELINKLIKEEEDEDKKDKKKKKTKKDEIPEVPMKKGGMVKPKKKKRKYKSGTFVKMKGSKRYI